MKITKIASVMLLMLATYFLIIFLKIIFLQEPLRSFSGVLQSTECRVNHWGDKLSLIVRNDKEVKSFYTVGLGCGLFIEIENDINNVVEIKFEKNKAVIKQLKSKNISYVSSDSTRVNSLVGLFVLSLVSISISIVFFRWDLITGENNKEDI